MTTLTGLNIITVSEGGLLYRDKNENVRLIDFRTCNANWIKTHGEGTLSVFDVLCVGWRNTGDRKYLDVELFTEPRTRFVFRSYIERDTLLIRPMVRARWHTLDLSRKA